MVEPGHAARALRLAAAGQAAVQFELGLAVVIACRFGPGSLAAKAAFSLQQRRLAREESEIELKFPGGDACAVGAAFLFQRPVVDPDTEPLLFGAGKRETGARRALVVLQPAAAGIAQRGMRNQDLARRERARIAIPGSGAG